MQSEHAQFVQRAADVFEGSTISHNVSAAEIHGRILTRLGDALDRRGPVRVQCPSCSGVGCRKCDGGRVAFDRVRNDQGARLELGERILAVCATEAPPSDRYWYGEARDAIARRRAQLSGGG